MLLHANASLTCCDNGGKTALDIAKARGQVECARLMFTPSSPAVADATAAAARTPEASVAVDDAVAERLGLLPLMRASGADDAATIARAVSFLEQEGARSLADVAKYGLAEEFLEALQLTGRVSRAKLRDELRALARQGEGLVARVGRLRAALSLPADPAELSLQAAVHTAVTQLGLDEQGPLQTQVDSCFATLGLDWSKAARPTVWRGGGWYVSRWYPTACAGGIACGHRDGKLANRGGEHFQRKRGVGTLWY